jgi:peroxiredoxin family protein
MGNSTEKLDEVILTYAKQRIKRKVEELVEQAKKDLDKEIDNICCHVILDVLQMKETQSIKDKIVFEIRNEITPTNK